MKTVRFSHFSRYSKTLFCLLLPALLLAQWVGLAHRIAHSGIASNPPTISLSAGANSHNLLSNLPFNDDPKLHSCIALDATTCADFLHTPNALLVVHANGQSAPLPDPFKLVLLETERFYPSRAPPLMTAHA
ncbi:MAG: hypothetical protein K2Y28_06655 [Burkholderiaceae bacterium]|nr:hypothetical protein [Burkholderiaceae bacterium]